MSGLQQREYLSRVHRVMDYIENNLDQELTLDHLAGVACFSRFHFHRIFAAITGETLQRFISRLRLERAAQKLAMNSETPVTEVAYDCGFSSPAVFSRAFRERYGCSPSRWRENPGKGNSNLCKAESKQGQQESNSCKATGVENPYLESTNNQDRRRTMNVKTVAAQSVEIKTLPERTVAYVRHTGPYQGNVALFEQLYEKLMQWAGPRELVNESTEFINVYHDDPNLTDDDKLRVSVCLTVPPDTEVSGEVGRMQLPGGKYAVAHFELNGHQFEGAWNWIFAEWLPGSGYQPDDRSCFEMCRGTMEQAERGEFIVDICIPVKPL